MRAFDQVSFAQAFSCPGIDPRQWVSYGTVDRETPEAPSVVFKDAEGQPSPYGPLVNVTLQPSGVSLPCRVGSFVAGNGEGEWFPFMEGDEVVVLLPEGSERAGAMIIARMNQELDAWPTVVAGQDPTKNTFGFRRMKTPYVVETAASYLIRSAVTGSQIGIDPTGNVIINDGDKGTLLIGPEVIGMASGDENAWVHVLPPSKEVYLGADTATFLLNATESKFISEGIISFATAGGAAIGNGVSAQQVVALLINLLLSLNATGNFLIPAVPDVVMNAALAAMAGSTPAAAPSVPGGNFAAFATVLGPVGSLVAAMSNPLAPIDPTGFVPGFGKAGFKL